MCSALRFTTNYRSELLSEKDNPFLSKSYHLYKFLKPSLREIFYIRLFPKGYMKGLQKKSG